MGLDPEKADDVTLGLFLAYCRFPKQNTRGELPDLQSPIAANKALDTSNRFNGVTSAAGPRRPQTVLCQASLERPVSRFCAGVSSPIAGSKTFPDFYVMFILPCNRAGSVNDILAMLPCMDDDYLETHILRYCGTRHVAWVGAVEYIT